MRFYCDKPEPPRSEAKLSEGASESDERSEFRFGCSALRAQARGAAVRAFCAHKEQRRAQRVWSGKSANFFSALKVVGFDALHGASAVPRNAAGAAKRSACF